MKYLLLFCLGCLGFAHIAVADVQLGMQRFDEAHGITRGVDFGEAACGKALPLLKEADSLFSGADKSQNPSPDYARLPLAHCLLQGKAYAEAARLYQSLLDLPPENRGSLPCSARMELAWLYSNGLGVPQDKTRALGLYMLCDYALDLRGVSSHRNAAELIIALNPRPTNLAYQLLADRRTPIKDKWRMWRLWTSRNEGQWDAEKYGPREDFFKNALAGSRRYLASGTPAQLDEEDRVATEQFSLQAAQQALEAGRLAPAWHYLRQAAPADALPLQQEIRQGISHRLIMSDGSEWQDRHE